MRPPSPGAIRSSVGRHVASAFAFHALARVDATDDFPMGWFLSATRVATSTS
jgi:hypothetical protein